MFCQNVDEVESGSSNSNEENEREEINNKNEIYKEGLYVTL